MIDPMWGTKSIIIVIYRELRSERYHAIITCLKFSSWCCRMHISYWWRQAYSSGTATYWNICMARWIVLFHTSSQLADMLHFGKQLICSFFLAGRLVLTTHALYFQSIRVGYGDKIVKYDLSTDSNQVIKRDLTGPLGVRLFDKAVMYKSNTL